MSDFSAIEWTDATWNPVMGCTKVSQGCKNCYAERLWPKVEGARVAREGGEPRPFTHVSTLPDRLHAPLHWKKPRMIFVNSMSDLFHANVPFMARCPQHTFQVLTKRADRMLEWATREGPIYGDASDYVMMGLMAVNDLAGTGRGMTKFDWPLPNVWPGVSAEDQETFDERARPLMETPAAVRWVSLEPLLGHIDLIGKDEQGSALHTYEGRPRLDWVVAGGESGPNARPSHPDWFRSLRDQCRSAGVPFFFKQWGAWAPLRLPESLKYRGVALDTQGKAPPLDALEQLCAGDTSILRGRVHLSFVGKKAAGRQLDGREWNEYPR